MPRARRLTPSAKLPDGTSFKGPVELRKVLRSHSDDFLTSLTEKLLTYALGRGLEPADAPAVRRIKREAAARELPLFGADSGHRREHAVSDEDGAGARELRSYAGDCPMVITKRALPRRTFIRGMGATLALPFLDAMVPATFGAASKAAPRFAAIYCGNGANMFDWTPPTEGAGFTFSPILKPLEPFRDRTLVFTGLDNFPATDQGDSGGQHPRAAPAFMSCVHPKQTEGADVQAGTTIDQLIAEQICSRREAVIPRSGRRSQRCRRRLRPRLRLRLHELHVVEDADDAAAGGNQSTVRVRTAVRQRRHRRRARRSQPGGPQHSRWRDAGDRAAAPASSARATASS